MCCHTKAGDLNALFCLLDLKCLRQSLVVDLGVPGEYDRCLVGNDIEGTSGIGIHKVCRQRIL